MPLVTVAARGVDAAAARRSVEAGYAVGLADLDIAAAENLARSLASARYAEIGAPPDPICVHRVLKQPLPRRGGTGKVAATITLPADPSSSFVLGGSLHVNDGYPRA